MIKRMLVVAFLASFIVVNGQQGDVVAVEVKPPETVRVEKSLDDKTVRQFANRLGLDPEVIGDLNGLLPNSVLENIRFLKVPADQVRKVTAFHNGYFVSEWVGTRERSDIIEDEADVPFEPDITPLLAHITASKANVRSAPDLKAKVVGQLNKKTEIYIYGPPEGGWFKVEHGKLKGWIHTSVFAFGDTLQGWRYLGTVPEAAVELYFKNPRRTGVKVEAWMKVLFLTNKARPAKNVAYALQFVTADCDRQRIRMEAFHYFDKNDLRLSSSPSSFISTPNSPVIPGSVGEIILDTVCSF